MSLNTLINEYSEAKKSFQEKAQEAMKAAFREVFEQFPEITAFRWTQYTPYFNDGEPCEFRVGDIFFTNIPLEDDLFEEIGSYGFDGDSDLVYTYGDEGRNATYFCVSDIGDTHYRTHLPTGPAYFDGKDTTALRGLLQALQSDAMEGVLEGTFGDHVCITATRNGFEVDDYDHD